MGKLTLKRGLVLSLISLTILLTAAACKPTQDPGQSDRPSVVTTVFPLFDFLRNVAGDAVELTMLLSPGQDAHTYEPTASDARLLAGCDLFVCIGGVSDYPFDKLIAASGQEKAIQTGLENALAETRQGKYYLVITFDRGGFDPAS